MPKWVIRWKSPQGEGTIRINSWVNGFKTFSSREEARQHVKDHRKEYEKEEPGITFRYELLLGETNETTLR